jgi:hypothetical protein
MNQKATIAFLERHRPGFAGYVHNLAAMKSLRVAELTPQLYAEILNEEASHSEGVAGLLSNPKEQSAEKQYARELREMAVQITDYQGDTSCRS